LTDDAPFAVARSCSVEPATGVVATARLTAQPWHERSSGEIPAERNSRLPGADKTTPIGKATIGVAFEEIMVSLPMPVA